ncbi:hypothetical protein [Pseudomonas putida]|uniref:Uncharacterized protein n=1 Tax=Pseudomonas putida TaxID=303 RepID=A0A8I1EHU7_PSEPU|nr:hypothetical protein [Pseudomonas putida]MBI6885791.1 hypothetical protein [Pseudomonas putida]
MTTIKNLDVEPIAKAIDDLAEDLTRRAELLRRHAETLRQTGDTNEISCALNVAVSTANLRVDLLLLRSVNQMVRLGTLEAVEST